MASLCFTSSLFAQNLVTNGSFEQYTTCPLTLSQMGNCVGWGPYTVGSPDYFTSCTLNATASVPSNGFGSQAAAHGNAYAGLVDYMGASNNLYREYIYTTISPLQIGATYEISMSVSLADNSGYGSNGLGVYFFDNAPAFVSTTNLVPVTTKVSFASYGPITNKTGWDRLVATFVADSAYDNLVIGGFLPPTSPSYALSTTSPGNMYAYYYIDSVVLKLSSNIFLNFTDSIFCAGSGISVPYTLNNPTYFNAGNVFTLQLSNAAGSFASPINLGTVTSTSAGTITAVLPPGLAAGSGYKVRIFANNPGDTSVPCTQTIDIKPLPVPLASASGSLCEGSTLNVSATALAGSAYYWTGPNGFSSTQQNNNITNATPANTGDYIVTATLNGCSAKDTVTATVKPMPAVPTANNTGPVCAGSALSFTANSITSGVSYNWMGPGGFNSIQQNPSITATTVANTGIYSVTVTLNGCTPAAATTAATVKPVPAVPSAGNNSPICAGADLQLTANSITTGVSYYWTGPGGFTSTLQNPVIAASTISNAGNYDVTAALNGCTSAAATTITTINVVSSIGGWVSPDDTICEGTLASFVVVTTNEGSSPQFQWFKNGVAIPGATSKLFTTSNISTGDSFYCRLIAVGVCTNPLTIYSNGIVMYKLPLTATPTIDITSNPVQPIPGQPVSFYATVANGGYSPTFQWKRNGKDVLGAIYPNWNTNNLNPYDEISCAVTSSDPCATPKEAKSDTIRVNFPTAISDISNNGGLTIYPNPNNGNFRITGNVGNEKTLVEIINAVGQVVYKNEIQPLNNKINGQIVLPEVANGAYLLRIQSGAIERAVPFTLSR